MAVADLTEVGNESGMIGRIGMIGLISRIGLILGPAEAVA